MSRILLILIGFALTISACSGSNTPAPAVGQDTYSSPNLDTTYEGASSVRNQLALGTLELDGTAFEITDQQAAQLLPLWQALRGTAKSGGSAQEEVNALLGQIEDVLTADQLGSIRELQIKQTDIQSWAKANGITVGTGGGQPGSGAGLSPEARATRQAEEGRTPDSAGGVSAAIIDAVITYLNSVQP